MGKVIIIGAGGGGDEAREGGFRAAGRLRQGFVPSRRSRVRLRHSQMGLRR